jgi:hypothetical protein
MRPRCRCQPFLIILTSIKNKNKWKVAAVSAKCSCTPLCFPWLVSQSLNTKCYEWNTKRQRHPLSWNPKSLTPLVVASHRVFRYSGIPLLSESSTDTHWKLVVPPAVNIISVYRLLSYRNLVCQQRRTNWIAPCKHRCDIVTTLRPVTNIEGKSR